MLQKSSINSEELESLLRSRAQGEIDFILVDVREQIEYDMGHIRGVNMLRPTSNFSGWAEALFNETKDKTVIFTCRTGSRSGQVQMIFKRNGHQHAVNHAGGIVTYRGETEK
ncbi:MAG: rhodanese-like domain-containing protein [Sulfurovum sp.]|nr:rhodanese-like domain-containing protein [Sulfurovum sp.]